MDGLTILIGCIAIAVVFYKHYIRAIDYPDVNKLTKRDIKRLTVYAVGDYIWLPVRRGYTKFKMMGMYYQDIPFHFVGRFNGYAKALTENNYDDYAIAIIVPLYKKEKQIGFVPRGNKELHSYILSQGGKVKAYGYIGSTAFNRDFYGEVCVKFKKELAN